MGGGVASVLGLAMGWALPFGRAQKAQKKPKSGKKKSPKKAQKWQEKKPKKSPKAARKKAQKKPKRREKKPKRGKMGRIGKKFLEVKIFHSPIYLPTVCIQFLRIKNINRIIQ